jgi:hypothetical protein
MDQLMMKTFNLFINFFQSSLCGKCARSMTRNLIKHFALICFQSMKTCVHLDNKLCR